MAHNLTYVSSNVADAAFTKSTLAEATSDSAELGLYLKDKT